MTMQELAERIKERQGEFDRVDRRLRALPSELCETVPDSKEYMKLVAERARLIGDHDTLKAELAELHARHKAAEVAEAESELGRLQAAYDLTATEHRTAKAAFVAAQKALQVARNRGGRFEAADRAAREERYVELVRAEALAKAELELALRHMEDAGRPVKVAKANLEALRAPAGGWDALLRPRR